MPIDRRRTPLLVLFLLASPVLAALAGTLTEAPAGFDDLSNGFSSQAQFDLDRATFEGREGIDDGLGPLYNAEACSECHGTPIVGASSQVSELRAARFANGVYAEPPGGSLINDRAIDAGIQERVTAADNVRTFRMSLSALGDGYVEAIADGTLEAIRDAQPPGLRGTVLRVGVGEAGGALRVARFGWKNQHASLLSFAADAYLNEMGITSPLFPDENTSGGASVAVFDTVPDPEEAATADAPFGPDVEAFARFMRSTKAPARDLEAAGRPSVRDGERTFVQIGCAHCHTPTIATAPAGTIVNGGTLSIPPALGDRLIHPFGDFLLHDVGTGDGIVQNGGPATRNQVRTAPLWGLRTRDRLMHDGLSLTRHDAIVRHRGQATPVTARYLALPPPRRGQLLAFLDSL